MNIHYAVRRSKSFYRMLWLFKCVMHPALCIDSKIWWKENRGRFHGRAGFVIGNGPSLRFDDLDRIGQSPSIASNKIYLAFPSVKWRPSYITCSDKLVWRKIASVVGEHCSEIVLTNTMPSMNCDAVVRYVRMLGSYESDPVGFSENCEMGVYGGWTVTYINLQIAVHLGLNPIYLIGCDHYYAGEDDAKKSGERIRHGMGSNHFISGYRSPGEIVHPAPIEVMNQAYACAARWALNNGVKVFNATRGGFLNIFPRLDLDKILKES